MNYNLNFNVPQGVLQPSFQLFSSVLVLAAAIWWSLARGDDKECFQETELFLQASQIPRQLEIVVQICKQHDCRQLHDRDIHGTCSRVEKQDADLGMY